MITLFTTPRRLEGQYDVIQTNALTSWSLIRGIETFVFADAEYEGQGAIDLATELGFHVETVRERSAHGVPLISDIFSRAQQLAGPDSIPCYVNADIIMPSGTVDALQGIEPSFTSGRYKKYLMVARRRNVQVLDYLEFTGDWWEELCYKVELQGSQAPECAIDLFAWKDDHTDEEDGRVFPAFKPYAIGRYTWDNALIATAIQSGAAVVDITPVLRLVHQSHHIVDWHDPDADYNRGLAGTYCSLKDSTHTLTKDGLVEGWRG